MTLLPAVLIAAASGSAIAWFSWWGLVKALHPTAKSPDPIDITKLAFTLAGGIGAVVALVVAYRRQRDVEQGRFVERFGAAAAQLGASQIAVRIAGVYAMAGVANESKGPQRQQCIDVLCGYLRLPYSPERGSNYQTKHIEKRKSSGNEDLEVENHFEYLQNDREVRQTILRVIADHLRSRQFNWSSASFDFRDAYLENVNFSSTSFKGEARFEGSTLVGAANFDYSELMGWVQFDNCTFSNDASFNYVKFGDVNFEGVTFGGKAEFWDVEFSSSIDFSKASFRQVEFMDAAFLGVRSDFRDAVFEGSVTFAGSTFSGRCDFGKAKFKDEARFSASFRGGATFDETDFGLQLIDFQHVRRWGSSPGWSHGWRQSKFDWSEDRSLKPPNVQPTIWPPEFP
ncbi:pentapeptide repeat-containing protein [Nocardia sp.]|uniref:pentapeptide repeat-containing protein n=1 Tax=Nocardia sp. TaxID=1821 RepID=UPI002616B5DC|nr:pentapeptide repeat-containing protein [Nocardia sp.]